MFHKSFKRITKTEREHVTSRVNLKLLMLRKPNNEYTQHGITMLQALNMIQLKLRLMQYPRTREESVGICQPIYNQTCLSSPTIEANTCYSRIFQRDCISSYFANKYQKNIRTNKANIKTPGSDN